jgi:hypothetical protein
MQNIEPPGLDIGGTCVKLPGNGGGGLWAARESVMTGWGLWSPVSPQTATYFRGYHMFTILFNTRRIW